MKCFAVVSRPTNQQSQLKLYAFKFKCTEKVNAKESETNSPTYQFENKCVAPSETANQKSLQLLMALFNSTANYNFA
jgi:hypothetical protein